MAKFAFRLVMPERELLATEAARDTVRIALAADVVRGYYSVRALDEQLAATRRTLALREDNLKLQRVRAQARPTTVAGLDQGHAGFVAGRFNPQNSHNR